MVQLLLAAQLWALTGHYNPVWTDEAALLTYHMSCF